ncbi:MAG: diguanylate cyclase [Sporolactobacillus sp.]
MSTANRRILWAAWVVLTPIALVLMYTADPPRNVSISSIVTVGIVFLITALFNFKVGGTDIIVLQGIGLAAFLIFGLFIEALFTQFGILVYLLSQKLNKKDVYRYPLNLLMFLGVSLSAALFYYGLGGQREVDLHSLLALNLLPVVGFYFGAYAANEVLLYAFRRWFLSAHPKFFEMDTIWEITVTFLMMPLGIAFCLMYAYRGLLGMYMIAVPMVALSVVIRLFNTSKDMNSFLQNVNRLGQKLTVELSATHVLDLLFAELPAMLSVDYAYIVTYTDPEHPKIIRQFRNEDTDFFVPFQKKADISSAIIHEGKPVMGLKRKEMYPYLAAVSNHQAKSYLSVPMVYRNQVIGVLTIASRINRAYTKTNRIGLEIISDFLAIALQNARSFEITKKESEHCPLTDLYNYRYFMTTLNKMFRERQNLSIIMLDIDNFKQINDTYGHQNGNEALIGVANRLRKTVGIQGIIARYGGEEFTIILPEIDRNQTFVIAERIRQAIASDPFMIFLENENRYKPIRITVSMGISSAPADAEDPSSLIANADRAMYSGAKRMGKNRVARLQ